MTNQVSFVKPTGKVRLGYKKFLRLKRAQDVIEAIAWGTVIAVVVMFLVDGGLKGIHDVPTALNALSRLTALTGTDLLLIHMLLIARVPWIDKFYGHDRATLAHKKLGKPVLYFVVVHFLASLTSYAITDGKTLVGEMINLFFHVPDMWTATIGLFLMIVVVITSLNFARRKMSYEAWYIVHITSYISVLAAVPHQFSTGSDIHGKPVAVVFWVTLYLFVVINLAWYRFLSPVLRHFVVGTKVHSVVRTSSDSVSIYMTGKKVAALGGKAGQFYMVRVLTPKQWWRPHPFSISAAPNSKYVRFTIGKRGDDTGWLQQVKPGTPVLLEGPYGVFTEERRTKAKVVLVASGIGIPPIRALAESMAARPGDVTVVYRVRNAEDAALLDEIKALCRHRGFALHLLAGPRASHSSWMSADGTGRSDLVRLAEIAPNIADSDVFICGPTGWTHSVEKSVLRAGAPANQVHAEEFAW
jgi:predicted ferric reductase